MIVGAVWQNICMSENQDGNRMLCVISRILSVYFFSKGASPQTCLCFDWSDEVY